MSYKPTKRERMKNFMGAYTGAERIKIGVNELGSLTGHAPSGIYAAVKWECEKRGWTYCMKDNIFIISPTLSKMEVLARENPCFGGHLKDDPFCKKCYFGDLCKKRFEGIEEFECFGGFIEEDPFCKDCDQKVKCIVREEELRIGKPNLNSVVEKVKVKITKSDLLDLEKDRLDFLCTLDVDQLVQITKLLGININHIDLQKESVETELVIEIDLFIEDLMK